MQSVNLSITTALCELQVIVSCVETALTQKEPNAIRQAKERYLTAAQTIKSLTEELHLPPEDIPTEELRMERDRLKKEVVEKGEKLRLLSKSAQEMLSALERWDQWELHPTRQAPQPTTFGLDKDDTRSIAETESVASDL